MNDKLDSEPGAPASQEFIPLCVPEIHGNEWKYIKECLDTNYVSSVGPFVDRFERELAAKVGTRYAVATVNGTAALHIALLVAGVKHDDEVLVSDLTFIAPVNAIRYVGAWPVLIDAEPDYWQMDPEKVIYFLDNHCQWVRGELRNKTTGHRIRAILPVHILGHPVDMDPILEVARKYELMVIEDATESLGAQYKSRPVGHLGDIACFSFNGNKIITTGGGGMIVTDNETWAKKAKYLTTQAKDDPVEFIHKEIGYNYRLSNIQAAMGCAQLELLGDYIEKKRAIASFYISAFRNNKTITFLKNREDSISFYWLFPIHLNNPPHQTSRDLLAFLETKKIQTRPLWRPMSMLDVYRNFAYTDCGTSSDLYHRVLLLPSSVGINEMELVQVADSVMSYFI